MSFCSSGEVGEILFSLLGSCFSERMLQAVPEFFSLPCTMTLCDHNVSLPEVVATVMSSVPCPTACVFAFTASEELTIAGMTFTTFDLGGHEQGKCEVAEPNGVPFFDSLPSSPATLREIHQKKRDTEQ